MANTFYVDQFRSPQTLAYVVYVLLGLQIIAFGMGIISALAYLASPDWSLPLDNGESTPVFTIFLGLSAMLRIGALLFTIVLFLVWEYRAFSNLSPLKARNLEFSPGWAVGWWFIPFANLLKPFQAVKELWRESDPDFDEDLGFMATGQASEAIFGFWWGTWIIGNIILRISDSLFDGPNANLKTAVYLYLVGSAVASVAAILLILIIRDITNRQIERNARLESSGIRAAEPPPPPLFRSEPVV